MKVNSLQEKRKRKKGHVWLSSKPAHEEQRQQGIPVPLEHERRIEFPLKKMLHVESNRYSLSLSLSYIITRLFKYYMIC